MVIVVGEAVTETDKASGKAPRRDQVVWGPQGDTVSPPSRWRILPDARKVKRPRCSTIGVFKVKFLESLGSTNFLGGKEFSQTKVKGQRRVVAQDHSGYPEPQSVNAPLSVAGSLTPPLAWFRPSAPPKPLAPHRLDH